MFSKLQNNKHYISIISSAQENYRKTKSAQLLPMNIINGVQTMSLEVIGI